MYKMTLTINLMLNLVMFWLCRYPGNLCAYFLPGQGKDDLILNYIFLPFQAIKEAIKGFCAFDNEASAIQERTVTVVYGPNMVDLTFVNFVTSSISEAGVWAKHLFRCTNNLLEDNASPLKCLERL